MKKIYSAFISSAFQSLRDERNTVINSLLDYRILPIGMEHFTVSSSGEFSDIQELIDDSDFFILLLGKEYGSCDEKGLSWTEKEYDYAVLKKKPIIAIICDELAALSSVNEEELSEQNKKQLAFSKKITYARTVSKEFSISTIINQFLNTYTFSKCVGWSRIENLYGDEEALLKWREEHKVFDISGTWHHVHLSDDDETYIRIGTVKIEQDFSPDTYNNLHIEGLNYNVDYYDSSTSTLKENKMKSSRFVGEYKLQDNGEIFGIFNSKRTFSSNFKDLTVSKGTNRGIHDFTFDPYCEVTDYIEGEFHDEAPSPKLGRIFLFRSIEQRNEFLLSEREGIVEIR